MQANEVVDIYRELEEADIVIWIDGGWAIDAVLGRQTRSHSDLDIAVEAKAVLALRQRLAHRGYRDVHSEGASAWNFVLADDGGRRIDVHVVVLDERDRVRGPPLGGIAYPAGSLTGKGVIADVRVRCVSADFLLQFKTSYPPRAIDIVDVAALCALLGRPVPDTHR